jgi:hypothetical protein
MVLQVEQAVVLHLLLQVQEALVVLALLVELAVEHIQVAWLD